jgi:cell division septation protein DedD
MTDGSLKAPSRGPSPPLQDSQSAGPTPNGGGDPLAELVRLIGHYEACGAIVRHSDRQEPNVEPSQRQEGPSPSWGGSTLAGSASSEETAGKAQGLYNVGQYEYNGPEYYSDGLPNQRRGLGMFAAVIALALAGSASAYGYWLWSGGAGRSAEPPSIKAETTPDKILPATQGDDSPWNKRIYGRFEERAPNAAERPIQSEVTPADVKPAATPQFFPNIGGVYGPSPGPAAGLAPGAAPPTAPTDAPPKQGPQRSNQGTAGPAPIVLGTQTPAAEPGAAPGGSYVVQLSSQRSEGAAQATCRSLQTRYPDLFGSRQPFIRRSDLGDRGVFYRAQVGPFTTIGEANQFCGSLKKAGGDCIVQKN